MNYLQNRCYRNTRFYRSAIVKTSKYSRNRKVKTRKLAITVEIKAISLLVKMEIQSKVENMIKDATRLFQILLTSVDGVINNSSRPLVASKQASSCTVQGFLDLFFCQLQVPFKKIIFGGVLETKNNASDNPRIDQQLWEMIFCAYK